MTDWQHIPDAPEKVKYHRGYDPADPPEDILEEQERLHRQRMLEHAKKWKATNEH